MKIVVLASVRFVYDARVFHKQCKSLAANGHSVTYIVPHTHDEVIDRVRIKAIPPPSSRPVRMTRTVWQVYRAAVALDADLYHFHDVELIPIALLLRARGKKVVYDVHDDAPQGILTKYYIPALLRKPLAWILGHMEAMACRSFSGMTTAVQQLADKYALINPNTVVIHNFPILREMPSPKEVMWDTRLPAIASVGGAILEERKLFQVMEALHLLPPDLGATLKLCGTFAPASLREAVCSMPGWKRVEELGYLDRQGIAKVLRESMLGIEFIQDEPRHHHALPVKMFEYMAAGLPVVATDFPLWRKILEGGGCGIVVDSANPREIARAIEYLLTHPREAEAMGRRGREAIEKEYLWENEEKKLIRFFTDLTKTGMPGIVL
jgi:glycosyltransferase involved in cell wall biosynthesis